MAKLTDLSNQTLKETFPEPLIRHHGKTLFPLMERWQKSGQIPPVLLLTGQPGIGKRVMALYLAQWLLCETPSASAPCLICNSCQKAALKNQVNLIEIVPDEEMAESSKLSSSSLKIDQFRDLKASAGFRGHNGAFKIILIPNVERMTSQAANSVLKLLEEPPQGWLFFLTTHDSTLLLPTLVSRCQALRLKPLSPSEIESLLLTQGIDPGRSKICAELSQGRWDQAVVFAHEEVWEFRKNLFQFFKEPHRHIHSLSDWATQKGVYFEILIDLLEQVTAELLTWSSTHPLPLPENYPWKNSDAQDELTLHAQTQLRKFKTISSAREFWISRAERLAEIRHDLGIPLNRKILIQDLLLPWMKMGNAS